MVYEKVDYRGYTPESFVEQRKEYLNRNPVHFCSMVSDFLIYYFSKYYWTDLEKLQELFRSNDEDCKSLAIQMLFTEHLELFTWITEKCPGIIVSLLQYYKYATY